MSYDWFNKKEILQKAKKKYDNCSGKEKGAGYYKTNKVVLKRKGKKQVQKFLRRRKRGKQRLQQE